MLSLWHTLGMLRKISPLHLLTGRFIIPIALQRGIYHVCSLENKLMTLLLLASCSTAQATEHIYFYKVTQLIIYPLKRAH